MKNFNSTQAISAIKDEIFKACDDLSLHYFKTDKLMDALESLIDIKIEEAMKNRYKLLYEKFFIGELQPAFDCALDILSEKKLELYTDVDKYGETVFKLKDIEGGKVEEYEEFYSLYDVIKKIDAYNKNVFKPIEYLPKDSYIVNALLDIKPDDFDVLMKNRVSADKGLMKVAAKANNYNTSYDDAEQDEEIER